MIYLDNSATTRPYDEVIEKMSECMKENFGNPSSLYRLGIKAEKLVKESRERVSKLMGVPADRVFFTSGGTEGDNTAIISAANHLKRRGKRIITTKAEHPAVLEVFRRLEQQGFETIYIDVDKDCIVDLQKLKEAINEDTILVSVMAVNNETGSIMPLPEIRRIIDEANKENNTKIIFHTDMVQSLAKVRGGAEYADIATVSAHKIHGPKGCGAIYIRKGLNIPAFIIGGGQEYNFRSGTENVPAIVGFGIAADRAMKNFEQRTKNMMEVRKYLLDLIKKEIPDIKINSIEEASLDFKDGKSCCSVINISFLRTRGEVILHRLEENDIYVSTGSACSSNKKGQSHVLAAMGLSSKDIEGAIRFSVSEFTTLEDIEYTVEKLSAAISGFRKLGSFR